MPAPVKRLPQEDLDHVLLHTRDLWSEAQGKSFFITGGTGFFGMWLLESFTHINDILGLGMRAVVLTRDAAAFARKAPHLSDRPDLEFLQGDIRSFPFPHGRFHYVVHAATEASAKLNQEAPDEMLDAIVSGTRRVLAFTAGADVEKFLLTSSGAVYGQQPSEMTHVPETYNGAPDSLLPGSAYGLGKRVSEHMCAAHAIQHGYGVKIAHCFAFVGPYLPLDSHFAIGNFIRNALNRKPIRIGGDGTPTRSYLYASDLTVWLWTLLFKGVSGKAYNVGSPVDLDIAALASSVNAALGGLSTVQILQKSESGRPVSRYVPSTARAQMELSLQVRIPLGEAIRKTAKWVA
jgi:nucleoside-diphosphate-sugar epimerase